MKQFKKLLMVKNPSGASDENISFEQLCQLLIRLGFDEILNLQPKQGKAKAYQVKQVREMLLKYQLGG
ncbi:type II toxin-antitoxin system HicA family toxin [Dolichospermum flos-aquae LEGE 04289]|uniref:Type II toxin-antitoxin system HicA family toxin n=1 Tax=Dolichospermum flos-aquae LEGE 04289 TaxID=1828708 RepID=A0ACC5PZ31_DOLFA|nr:type II toxin-antitoxin system HicA family toxin [Dolichospermum flos-aquae LEGE 04289]